MTKQKILEHANSLIQSVGFKGFSYADLSKEIGIAKASIHHHFPTKEDLGVAYCEGKLAALQEFRNSLSELKNSHEKLDAYLSIFGTCKDGKMCGINAMQSDAGDMSDRLITMVRKVSESELEILTEILTVGRSNHEFAFDVTPYEQAALISSALKGALLLARVKKDDSFDRVCNAVRKSIEYKNN